MNIKIYRILFFVALLGAVSLLACAPQGQRLRLINQSAVPISNLSVLFPEQEVAFGDVAANATTEYKVFPKGVYGYAAYRYDMNGKTITQPVIDWVGEKPMQGSAFTYTILFDPNNPQLQAVQLVKVARDE